MALVQMGMSFQPVCGQICGLWTDNNNEHFSALAWKSSSRCGILVIPTMDFLKLFLIYEGFNACVSRMLVELMAPKACSKTTLLHDARLKLRFMAFIQQPACADYIIASSFNEAPLIRNSMDCC
jgi:hypothetical protein